MKRLLLIFLLAFPSMAIAQDTAAIYNFNFLVDDELTDEISVSRGDGFFKGWSMGDDFPEFLIDSIKSKTTVVLSALLSMPAILLYKKDKDGKPVEPLLTSGGLEGLPALSAKAAREVCTGCKRFVSISVHIYAGGETSVVLGGEKKSKIKPRMDIWVKVYDEAKNVVLERKGVNKNFEKLRASTVYEGTKETRTSTTLNPYDIYAMYLISLYQLIEVEVGTKK